MLYDPKWEQHTLLDQWIAWLETQNPGERYDWMSYRRCACGQFYGSGEWVKQSGVWWVLNMIARGPGLTSDWTFGKCLERAKAYRANPL